LKSENKVKVSAAEHWDYEDKEIRQRDKNKTEHKTPIKVAEGFQN